MSTPARSGDSTGPNIPLTGDFRATTTLALAIVALVFLSPFAINNFAQGRYYLGFGSMVIVILSAVNAWTINRGRYYPLITLLGVTPAILVFLAISFTKQGVIGALWCYPAVLYFYFTLPESKAWIANGLLVAMVLPLTWLTLESGLGLRVGVTLCVVSIFSAIFVRVLTGQQKQLEDLAVTDTLTGLSNRAMLNTTLAKAAEQSRRTGAQMTLVSLDLDHFKKINDDFGHDGGDKALRALGSLLRKRVRTADSAFRLGGEEFLLLLYGTSNEKGRQFAETLRQAIANMKLFPDHTITTSIGVATLLSGEDTRDWVKRSDKNLYIAKSTGRNRVVNQERTFDNQAEELFGLPVV